ncbi:putative bifunctional diguanylate cyclase/phosphodiesterase [Terribacillus saccharophilus]|uniref:putative bifunctional diguanylate cyclase/phosphodiesterase n=1 Tax=Terribacillus saccharophilus TaxID=361277 RepID=UPI002DC474D9|nr:EAL domain-containing protein [Terribacillus saccharophilus]
MNVYKPNKDKWREELHLALEREEFCLLYQPKLNLKTGKLCGVEALIRWEHPEQGIISPLDFIPAAEETGMILPIGEWVLREACMQNIAWQEQGLSCMIVAVNLSAPQLYQSDLAEKVQSILDESGLAPEYLELEITESMTMDVHSVLPVLHQLKQMGVRISMDDFGTGFSSLYHLKEFPIDSIKIDRSFVRNCTNDSKDATIVKTIIAMAHQLKLEVIAEGVETNEQMEYLCARDCYLMQGYFFSRPMPAEDIAKKYFL